ncbi:hypothetical protein HDU82_001857 [Entophlyctis luteolus]|nr:hypothetical protein HDU82_001857 [Entophlyctis luteolus]
MGILCCKPEVIDFSQEVELKHFELLTAIGKGAFGKVKIVQHKQSKIKYALKYIDKKMCIEMKAVDCIIQERFLLEQIQSPFTCNLRYAFQDDENMFMVIDLMLGGDLRFLLNSKGPLAEDLVQLYAAECALGIDYLHSKSIVHRDLKPDNILISETGHATLTDFNIATKFNPNKPMQSEAGSPAYMGDSFLSDVGDFVAKLFPAAPEIFKKTGYNQNVDWWSLGIIIYELFYNKVGLFPASSVLFDQYSKMQRPFEASSSDILKVAIVNDEVAFKHSREISADSKSAITQFLIKDPERRLQGRDQISSHPFFIKLDWDAVERQEVKPSFIPDIKSMNCDFTHELEEILVNDNPLVAKARKPGENKYAHLPPDIGKQYQKMEDQFLNFDYTKPEKDKELKSKILNQVLSVTPEVAKALLDGDSEKKSLSVLNGSQDVPVPSLPTEKEPPTVATTEKSQQLSGAQKPPSINTGPAVLGGCCIDANRLLAIKFSLGTKTQIRGIKERTKSDKEACSRRIAVAP